MTTPPPAYPGAQQAAPTVNTSKSTTAMVFGIVAAACTFLALIFGFIAPVAIAFGITAVILAHKDRRATPPKGAAPGATLTALICGYASIAVSTLLILAALALFVYVFTVL